MSNSGQNFVERIAGYTTMIDDQFSEKNLNPATWLPYYLPQWAGRESSSTRYRLKDDHLELFIAADQQPWLPEIEGDLRVSSLQTGCFAGPVGSTVGQHRTNDALRVVEQQDPVALATPQFAAVELRAKWTPAAGQMVALWMIGYEDEPERSAEICVCEIFGNEADPAHAQVGMGVHPFNDPAIRDDFTKIEADIDVSEWHDYAAVWTPSDVTFFIDDEPVKHVDQSPQYPMQLMLNIYDFEPQSPGRAGSPFVIDRVRILQPQTIQPRPEPT